MKNIQIIDGADNCVYDIFACTEEEFALIFPAGTDIAFIDEIYARGRVVCWMTPSIASGSDGKGRPKSKAYTAPSSMSSTARWFTTRPERIMKRSIPTAPICDRGKQ